MKVERARASRSPDRARYVVERYGPWLRGRLLDVGCGKAHLKVLLPDVEYTGIDVAGTPDVRVNLEEAGELPFGEASFDTVVCTDVLEHLDNLHQVFSELVRVARGSIIVSLPNGWCKARRPIERGRGSISYHGLPPGPPAARHKWFFSLTEAADFLRHQEELYPISIVEVHAVEKPRPILLRALRRLRYPVPEAYLNRYAHTLWALLTKK